MSTAVNKCSLGKEGLRRLIRSVPVASHDIFMDGDGVDPAHDHSDIQIRFHYGNYMCQKSQRYIVMRGRSMTEENDGRFTYCSGWYRDPRGARRR